MSTNKWTRDDLPDAKRLHDTFMAAPDIGLRGSFEHLAVQLIAHLNAHHPKLDGEVLKELARARRIERERDAAVERAEQAERERWVHETPAVSRADIEKALREAFTGDYGLRRTTDAVWALVSGSDPAVYVVRESDIAAVEVERERDGDWSGRIGNQGLSIRAAVCNDESLRGRIEEVRVHLACREAIRRAIEAEQAEDPVEELAGQIETAAREAVRKVCVLTGAVVPGLDAGVVEEMLDIAAESRRLARHVLGQEASSDE